MRITLGWVGVLAICITNSIAAAGCGDDAADDGGGDAGATSIPPSASKLSEISAGQAAAFCGSLASIQGGYGRKTRVLSCGEAEVTLSFDPGGNQTECQASFRQLPAACSSLTTGQIETCVQDIWAATCETRATPSCGPFLACTGGGS